MFVLAHMESFSSAKCSGGCHPRPVDVHIFGGWVPPVSRTLSFVPCKLSTKEVARRRLSTVWLSTIVVHVSAFFSLFDFTPPKKRKICTAEQSACSLRTAMLLSANHAALLCACPAFTKPDPNLNQKFPDPNLKEEGKKEEKMAFSLPRTNNVNLPVVGSRMDVSLRNEG